MTGTCQHCKKKGSLARRGLCHPCYKIPAIRRRYPKIGEHGGKSLYEGVSKLPQEATDAPPASDRKIRVMMERVERGESVSHPEDNGTMTPESYADAKRRAERRGIGHE